MVSCKLKPKKWKRETLKRDQLTHKRDPSQAKDLQRNQDILQTMDENHYKKVLCGQGVLNSLGGGYRFLIFIAFLLVSCFYLQFLHILCLLFIDGMIKTSFYSLYPCS